VIIGTQRGGTTSMQFWLCSHPMVAPPLDWEKPEVHYFDNNYGRGERWHRAQLPIRRGSRMTIESSPYMLFHPLAPERARRDLPPTTRFIVLLRDPVQRAISHYWLEWGRKIESEALDVALALEDERLAGQRERVLRGERSFRHRHFSYRTRGYYAEQLRRWFDAVGRERILVVESEQLFADAETSATVLRWLDLAPFDVPFPAVNEAPRAQAANPTTVEALRAHFEPHMEELFELLGHNLWER
jgi:hypothetical protein